MIFEPKHASLKGLGLPNETQIPIFDLKIIDEIIYCASSYGLTRVDIYCDTSDYLLNQK